MRRVIWTIFRVYPERGRCRVLDTPDDDFAAAEFRRHVGLVGLMNFGRVELRRDGELWECWPAGRPSLGVLTAVVRGSGEEVPS